MWLGVDLRMDTKKTCNYNEIEIFVQNMLTILGPTDKIIERTYMTI